MEKLRQFFVKRGIASTTATLAGAISANSVLAAPVALAKSVTAVAIAKGAAASGSTLTLIKGALKIMAWTKVKTAIVAGAIVLLAAGTTTVVVDKTYVRMNSVLKQRLPDGSLLTINQVSFGDKHQFVHSERKNVWSWPGLVVEFKLVGNNLRNNPLVSPAFYRQFRCIIRGEHGIEYVEEFEPDNFKADAGAYYSYIETSIFPRDSRWLWFQIEKRDDQERYDSWQTEAEFKIKNPATSQNLKWTANPTPATNSINGMDFVLDEITVQTVPNYTNDIWNHIVAVPTRVFDNGLLLTNWTAAYIHMGDASGNWNPILQKNRSLDPDYVWKLRT